MIPIPLSPATGYATRINIAFPGSQAQATALEAQAATRINDALLQVKRPNVAAPTVTIPAGQIVVAT